MADDRYPIEIRLSEAKLRKMFLFLLEFVGLVMIAFAAFLFLMGDELSGGAMEFVILVPAILLISALAAFCYNYRRYYKKRDSIPGLVIDAEGLLDNFAGKTPLRIRRCDITGVQVHWGKARHAGRHYIARENLVVLKLQNPTDYIQRQPGRHRRLVMRANLKMHGSPFCFNDDLLEIRFKDLVILLEKEFGSDHTINVNNPTTGFK